MNTSELTSDISNIEDELKSLQGKAGGAFAGQAKSLRVSVNQIARAAEHLDTNPTGAVRQLTRAISGLKAKAKPAIAKMNSICPR